MKITFSQSATAQLTPLLASGRLLKLLYDVEGCGCVMSGVPALQLVDAPGPDDQAGNGQPLPFLYEPRHAVFFEDELRVDYSAEKHTFSLKSDSQIYTTHLRLLA